MFPIFAEYRWNKVTSLWFTKFSMSKWRLKTDVSECSGICICTVGKCWGCSCLTRKHIFFMSRCLSKIWTYFANSNFFQKLIMHKFLCQVACLEFEPLLQITVFHKTLIWKGPKSENIGNQQVWWKYWGIQNL